MKRRIASVLLAGWALPVLAQAPTRALFDDMPDSKLASIPDFVLPARYKDRNAYPLPASVDNTVKKFMPPYEWTIQGWSCANATAVSFVYDYEVQRLRNLPSQGEAPPYTYEYTYHFLNGGDQAKGGDGWMFVEAFDILKQTGGASSGDFGGFEYGNITGAWMSGYDKYLNAMRYRVSEYYKIDASKASGDELIKQYLHDHGDGSDVGGLLTFQVNGSDDGWTEEEIEGRRTITGFAPGGGHSMVLAGYDDNFQGGSYLVVNNWGDGLYWAPYRLFRAGGGLATDQGTPVMFCRVREGYSPQLTLKITLTHDHRGSIALLTGVANSQNASAPVKTKDYAGAFNFAGGPYPMMGRNQSSTIEIGLDLTDFAGSLTGKEARFFFQVVSKGGTGKIDKVTLMDYTGGQVKEIPSAEADKVIAAGATTTISIPWSGTLALKPRPSGAPAGRSAAPARDIQGRRVSTRPGKTRSARIWTAAVPK